jgi:hypothetical protein
MLRSVCIATVLGALTVSPILADIVNVAVNGTVSGSGSVTVECGVGLINPPAGCVDVSMGLYLDTTSFSFSGTNSDQLLYGTSASEPPDSQYPLLLASPYQNTFVDDYAAGTLDIFLGDNYSYSVGNSGFGATSFQLNENDNISVAFELTEASMALLDLGSVLGGASGSAELLDSAGNVIASFPSVGTGASLDLLEPGAYQLDFAMSGSAMAGYPGPDGVQGGFE